MRRMGTRGLKSKGTVFFGLEMFYICFEFDSKLIIVMIAQFCEYTKTQWIVCVKWVNCMVCELSFNKAVTEKRKKKKKKKEGRGLRWWKGRQKKKARSQLSSCYTLLSVGTRGLIGYPKNTCILHADLYQFRQQFSSLVLLTSDMLLSTNYPVTKLYSQQGKYVQKACFHQRHSFLWILLLSWNFCFLVWEII